MNEQLSYTVHEIYRLASEYADDVKAKKSATLAGIFDLVRRIPYRRDIDSCGEDECLKRPRYGLIEGDCDDKTIIAGAYMHSLGVPWRVKTVSYSEDGEMQHVYPEVFVSGRWLPFDATYAHNKIFTEKPYTNSVVWENPNMNNRRFGVATLEGLGFEPLLILADIDGLVSKIQNLPIIGSLFRGKTQHQTYDESLAAQQSISNAVVTLRRKLPPEGQQYLDTLAKSFWDNHVQPGWGTWWDSAVQKLYNFWTQQPAWQGIEYRTSWYIGMPVFIFMFNEDVTRVSQSIQSWYVGPVKTKVWDPLDTWVRANMGETLSQLQEQGGAASAGQALSKITSSPIALAAIGAALFFTMGKR